MGQNFKNVSKFGKFVNILKMGQNFEARVISPTKLFPQIRASFTNDARASFPLKKSRDIRASFSNDARASFPAQNCSRKSARHLQMTRAREMRVDTRDLPGAFLTMVDCKCNRNFFIELLLRNFLRRWI